MFNQLVKLDLVALVLQHISLLLYLFTERLILLLLSALNQSFPLVKLLLLMHLVLLVHPEVVALFVKFILEALISLLVDHVKLATAHIELVLLTMTDLI